MLEHNILAYDGSGEEVCAEPRRRRGKGRKKEPQIHAD